MSASSTSRITVLRRRLLTELSREYSRCAGSAEDSRSPTLASLLRDRHAHRQAKEFFAQPTEKKMLVDLHLGDSFKVRPALRFWR